MKNKYHLFFLIILFSVKIAAQKNNENIVYIVDEIVVKDDPERGNNINNEDIEKVDVVKNKDSLKKIGFEKFDRAIFIYTKEYKKRNSEDKKIPSTKQMEMKNGNVWYFNNQIYNGKFIDYYYNGKIQGEGILNNGKLEGLRKIYFPNGNISMERNYTQSMSNGLEKEYYEDGSLKQKGIMKTGKEDGIWEMYFPNGQVKQRTNFDNGKMIDKSVIYYSNGNIYGTERIENGKIIPDSQYEEINKLMKKSNDHYQNGNIKSAIKQLDKVILINENYQAAYFSKGTMLLNEMKFDEAIVNFDKALDIEPFYENALSNRAFARIRKYELAGNKIFGNKEITVLTSKKKVEIPEIDLNKICSDLKQAIFLGDKNKMNFEEQEKYCFKK
ncbi:hypothetical protein [Kaistella sp.]|uniref:hypothetical protein n=1 Tax=Kaistella sp. TaxID=2782235 RepID=UPI003C38E96E